MTFSFDARNSERNFDVQLTVGRGETVAVLGPNGAGKSTLLDLIAGVIRADSGRAELDGRLLFRRGAGGAAKSSNNRVWVPPHERAVSMLAQEALLFPHLTVRQNVEFGPRSAGLPRAEAAAIGRTWLERVDALDLADRRPAQLSGGQAQRIAVARALATDPQLLLLDEPMAALDITVAPVIRRMLKRMLIGRSAIIVTHDMLDALILADRVIIIENGQVVDDGPTRSVFSEPRSQFAAELAGLNFITGTTTARGLSGPGALLIRTAQDGVLPAGTLVGAALSPTAISVTRQRPPGEALNCIFLRVRDLEPSGDRIRIRTDLLSADVTPQQIADLELSPQDSYWFSFSPSAPQVYALDRNSV